MNYKNNVPEKMKIALSIMLYTTCGEDDETLAGTEITTIGPNIFHVQYALDDPFEAMDFQVAVDIRKDTIGATSSFHYCIFRSLYGDNGEFSIELN